MGKQIFIVFMLCFCVWAVVVDNVVIPSADALKQDVGVYTRYHVKRWEKGSKLDLLNDEVMVYAIVDNRERLYYMEYKPHIDMVLKTLTPGTPLQLRYVNRFPKFWKRQLYEVRESGIPVFGYSPAYRITKQREIWKFTGIMVGSFAALVLLGLVNKARRR